MSADEMRERELKERIQHKMKEKSKSEEERLRERLKSRQSADRRNSSGSDEGRSEGRSYDHRDSYRGGDDRYDRDRRRDDRRYSGERSRYDDYDRRRPPSPRGRHYHRGPPDRRYDKRPPSPDYHRRDRYGDRHDDRYHDDYHRRGRRPQVDDYGRNRRHGRSRSRSDSSCSSRSSSSRSSSEEKYPDDPHTKDQRTIFLNQIVLKADEKDIKKFFKKKGIAVREISMLRDKRSNRHKGCAYVELASLHHVRSAIALNEQAPTFQKFPILIKASEAEKNRVAAAAAVVQPTPKIYKPTPLPRIMGPHGQLIQAQRLYLGNLDPSITTDHLFVLFSPFGSVHLIQLQTDSTTGISKGFAFLQYGDAKDAYLALSTLQGQVLAGRAMKTGWASQAITTHAVQATEFPSGATEKASKALGILAQLNMGASPSSVYDGSDTVAPAGTVAEARASLAAAAIPASVTATIRQTANNQTPYLLVHNMFDKDTETEPNWQIDLRDEFVEEIEKFGKVIKAHVLSQQVGGRVVTQFETYEQAKACAATLEGRWFDKRQLRVEHVSQDQFEAFCRLE